MGLNEYQEKAMSTCMPSCRNISYMLLNLVGEVGEFASKVAKAIRKEQMAITENQLIRRFQTNKEREQSEKSKEELKAECGDILWQLSGLCTVMGWSLEEVAEQNLAKLQARKENGTIAGSGDGVTKEERGW